MIIELDGVRHAELISYNQHPDAWLRGQGYRVMRFWNNEVMQQLDRALEQIRLALSPGPSPI